MTRWLALLAVSCSACASSTTPDTSRTIDGGGVARDGARPPTDSGARADTGPIGEPCAGMRCALFEACVDGACTPYRDCVAASMCGAGEICRNRYCVPADRDLDGDGFPALDDCDESSPAIHPGATETCNLRDDDCDEAIDEDVTQACTSACGAGVETCVDGAFAGCSAPTPSAETCDGTDEDCDGTVDEGLMRGCATACGSGTETCVAGRFTGCTAPAPSAETCNLADDDCDGGCDEAVSGCRTAVHRSWHPSRGEHFYTTSLSEASCCGFTIEAANYYYLYAAPQAGLVPFYRCLLANGFHFYTQSATCEGAAGATQESIMGYMARAPTCGSTPLYRMVRGPDHFYTVSAAERDNAVTLGYAREGDAGHVWTSP